MATETIAGKSRAELVAKINKLLPWIDWQRRCQRGEKGYDLRSLDLGMLREFLDLQEAFYDYVMMLQSENESLRDRVEFFHSALAWTLKKDSEKSKVPPC